MKLRINDIPYSKPIDFFQQYSQQQNVVLLTGSGVQKDIAEYSLIGINAYKSFSCSIEDFTKLNQKEKNIFWNSLQEILSKTEFEKATHPANRCGLIGFLSYEARHFCEQLPHKNSESYELPIYHFVLYKNYFYFDHFAKRAYEIIIDYQDLSFDFSYETKACHFIEKTFLNNVENSNENSYKVENLEIECNEEKYVSRVHKIKEYIYSGDVYEVNLSQQIIGEFSGNPFSLFQKLYELNDAPYSSFMNYEFATILGNSPELFLRCEGNKIETRPIKGTIKRGKNCSEDQKNKSLLISSKKDEAELFMIIDLMRNDLGRICEIGSVKVIEEKRLEQYRNVWHLVGIVEGQLQHNKNYIDLLKATFPGGSITGCPKIRCMEIIEEIENFSRQLYTGSIIVMNKNYFNSNIVIRTSIIKNNKIIMNSGGAITIDSDPKSEYWETIHKIQSHLDSIKC